MVFFDDAETGSRSLQSPPRFAEFRLKQSSENHVAKQVTVPYYLEPGGGEAPSAASWAVWGSHVIQ